MKKFKACLLCLLLAGVVACGVFPLRQSLAAQEIFQPDSRYMTAENLAVGTAAGKASKLTDADYSTVYHGLRKGNATVDLDLGKVQPFNCVILKEDGLNIQSFTILASQDGETYQAVYRGDKIEYHRLCTFDTVHARYIRVLVNASDRFFKLREIEVYNQPQVSRPDFRVSGYVVIDDLAPVLQDASLNTQEKYSAICQTLQAYHFAGLTHVYFYCGASFDENAAVFLGGADSDQQAAQNDLALVLRCMRDTGQKDLKISCVFGIGTGNPALHPAMGEKQTLFIQNLIAFANQFGFDGIDFDYEFPQSDADYQVFGDFLVALKARMNTDMAAGEDALLSCAFGTRDITYPPEVVKAIDMVNMMTYDIFDQDGEHSSFWSCAVQGAQYLESVGFTKEQINIGIPFYGTQTDALMEQYIYKNADHFDYFNNYYTFPSYYDGSPTEVYFNSPAMVRDKTAYALLNGYGGVMVWQFFCDTEYSSQYSLWRAVYTAVSQFGGEA